VRTLRRIAIFIAGFATLAYVAWLALLYVGQSSMLYPGTRTVVGAEPPQAEGLEVVRLTSSAGSTEALFLAPTGRTATRYPAMIFTHGNGEVTDFWVHGFDGFRERGVGVLLVEYPGYGRSAGKPSEDSIRAVLDAAYDHLVADGRVDAQRIFGFGQSLGGGAICLLANDPQRPLRALILQSTFPSLAVFAAGYGAPKFLLRDRYDNLAAVSNFRQPLLVIHGREDTLIPWQQGQQLAAAAPHATFRLYECGHGCWDPEHNAFWQDAEPFLRAAGVFSADTANNELQSAAVQQ